MLPVLLHRHLSRTLPLTSPHRKLQSSMPKQKTAKATTATTTTRGKGKAEGGKKKKGEHSSSPPP